MDFKGLADQTFHTESASYQDKDFNVSRGHTIITE